MAQEPPEKTPPDKPAAPGPSPELEEAPEDEAQSGEKIADQFLRESGELQQEVIEIAARDVAREAHHEERLAQVKAGKRETFYSDLLYTLTNLRYDEPEARVLWVNLLSHKMEMSDHLDRNVGIRVAALDYFKNILGALDEVKIVDASSYIETAQLAVTDPLTGIFNHRYFQDRLLRDINRANEENDQLSLLMIDIDFFKQYNDINGHIAGDVALKEVASVLRRNLKRNDLVARYGGEEFAVILVGLSRERARIVAERIRKRVLEREFPNERVLPGGQLTISVGLAEFPGDAHDRGSLIGAADRALYIAKRAGKNQVALTPSDQRRDRRVPLALKVRYRHGENLDEAPLEAQSSNLSTGGLCMSTTGSVRVGQLLYLGLDGLPGERPILGRVVWHKAQGHGRAQVGVKFVNLEPQHADKIHQLLG